MILTTYQMTYQAHPAPAGVRRSWSSWDRGRPARFNPPVGRRPTCGCLVRFNPRVGRRPTCGCLVRFNPPVGLRRTCGRAARAPRGDVPRRRSRTSPGEPGTCLGVCRESPLGTGAFPWERGRLARFNPRVGRRPTCGCPARFNPPVGLRRTCGRAARAPRGDVPRRRSHTSPGEPSTCLGVCRESPLGTGALPWERGRLARFNPRVGRRPTCGCPARFDPPVGLRPTCGRAARAPRGDVPRRRSRTIPGEPSTRMGVCGENPLGMGAVLGPRASRPLQPTGGPVPHVRVSRPLQHPGGPSAHMRAGRPRSQGRRTATAKPYHPRGAQHVPGGFAVKARSGRVPSWDRGRLARFNPRVGRRPTCGCPARFNTPVGLRPTCGRAARAPRTEAREPEKPCGRDEDRA